MYSYIKGIVTEVENNYITIECYGIGYLIYVSNPFYYKLDNEYTIYIYQQIREDENTLYGFKSKDEKELFFKLISVKGLGPKMALPILGNSLDDVYSAIEKGDVSYLKKFPKIGDKVARQIILDLKGKLAYSNVDANAKDNDELILALKSLGYKQSDIKSVLGKIDNNKLINDQIKDALRLLSK